jgi:cytochrome c553
MRQKLGFILSIALFGCLVLATRVYLVDVPIWRFFGGGKRLDPSSLHLAGEFMESNLGATRDADGSVTVRMIAQQYLFVPQNVAVPADVPVHFRITSADNVHLLSVRGTKDSLKAMPGEVTGATFQFHQTGEFDMPCGEFCGPGHFSMRAHLEVMPPGSAANEVRSAAVPAHVPSDVAWTSETIRSASGGDAFRGSLIAQRCSHCHGMEGFSAEAFIPNLAGMDPLSIWKQLEDFRSGKRISRVMQPIATLLSTQNAADVAMYFSMLPTFPDPQDNRTFPQAVPDSEKSHLAERLIVFGDGPRGIPPCEACHGPVGYAKGAPALAVQNSGYLLSQLQHFSDDSRANDINLVMRSIAKQLTDEEKAAVSDYYGAGRGPSTMAARGPRVPGS